MAFKVPAAATGGTGSWCSVFRVANNLPMAGSHVFK
jgi:hypothetical protein